MKKLLSIVATTALLTTIVMADDPFCTEQMNGLAGPDKKLTLKASNTAVFLKATPVNAVGRYHWYEGEKFIGFGIARWYVIDDPGIHTIEVKVEDENGSVLCDTMDVNVSFLNGDTNITTLSADAGPDITFTRTPSRKQVRLVGKSTQGTSKIVKEEWYVDDGNVTNKLIWTGSSRWYNVDAGTTYTFTFKVTDEDNNTAEDEKIVEVN